MKYIMTSLNLYYRTTNATTAKLVRRVTQFNCIYISHVYVRVQTVLKSSASSRPHDLYRNNVIQICSTWREDQLLAEWVTNGSDTRKTRPGELTYVTDGQNRNIVKND